jgi:serine/threonine protein kinase
LCRRRARKEGSHVEPQLYVSKELVRNPNFGMKLVKRELETLRVCEHPNILRYEDFSYGGTGLDSRSTRLFTEHCALGDLDQFNIQISGRKRLSSEEGLQVFRQLAQALLYIHHGIFSSGGEPRLAATVRVAQRGSTALHEGDWQTILHRDIKPGNGQSKTLLASRYIILVLMNLAVFVALRSQGIITVKLGDFGLARLDADGSMTYVGTTAFLAPVCLSISLPCMMF